MVILGAATGHISVKKYLALFFFFKCKKSTEGDYLSESVWHFMHL